MAVTKIWKVKERLDATIEYVVNRRKNRRKIISDIANEECRTEDIRF